MPKKQRPETFNDGIVTICQRDEEGEAGKEQGRYRFGYQTMGATRFYQAQAVQVELTELIRIPLQRQITAGMLALMNEEQYDIKQAQHIKDSRPPKTVLSLKRRE